MTDQKKKAPAATGAIKKSEPNPYEGEQTMSTVSQFKSSFEISTAHASISIDAAHSNGNAMVCLDIDGTHSPLSPAEALSVAAALQAVSVHLMEQTEARAA